MNKKIIAIAIAAAMSAPVMADVKITGAMGGDLTFNNKAYSDSTNATASKQNADDGTKANTTFNDNGMTQVNFVVTEGNSFGKLGMNYGGSKIPMEKRDFIIGHKLGGGMAFSFGTMSGALKNMEKDPYIATFLQLRGTNGLTQSAKQYGSAGFVKDLLQLTMKAGPANVKIQYDATDNDKGSDNEGHTAVGVTGKAGAVAYFAGYSNGTGNETDGVSQSNVKVGASMKFGAVKATLALTTSDDGSAANSKAQATAIMADMGMGNGLSANIGYGMVDHDTASKDGTWMRLAVAKKLSKKATVYGGYTASKNKDAQEKTRFGAGMTVKF